MEAQASCPPLDGFAVANLCGNRASRLVENSYRQARHRTSPSDWRTGCPPAPTAKMAVLLRNQMRGNVSNCQNGRQSNSQARILKATCVFLRTGQRCW